MLGGNEPGSNPSQLPHKLSKEVSGAITTLLPPPRHWVVHRGSSCSFLEDSSWLMVQLNHVASPCGKNREHLSDILVG